MSKSKSTTVEPESFDPEVPGQLPDITDPENLPGEPISVPLIPGNDDDSDDEKSDENEAPTEESDD
jgi:hypothetical protein